MYTLKQLLEEYPVVIPMIQRDYAQGRLNDDVTKIRKSIVGKLKAATVDHQPVDLDFIYGAIKNETLRPLDGQQRLTTLYLLYWFIGYRRGEHPDYLDRFSYETRITARDFFKSLTGQQIIGKEGRTVQERICDQKWFRTSWLADPTISGALVMLNELEVAFKDVETTCLPDLIHQEPNVAFHYLDLDKYELDESLYIKMNSRGKPLSPFDNFKAQFEQHLFESGMRDEWEAYKQKVEVQWVDVLWPHRDPDTQTIDDAFLNIFRYWTSTLALKNDDVEEESQKEHWQELITPEVFTRIYKTRERVEVLFDVFDMWGDSNDLIDTFRYYSNRLPHIAPDLLERFVTGRLSNADQIIVYTILRLKQNGETSLDLVRVVRNLTEGIRQKISGKYDTNLRFERFGTLYRAIDECIGTEGDLSGRIEKTMTSAFPSRVVKHEIEKCRYYETHHGMKSALQQLEDMDLLKGMTHRVFPAFQLYGAPLVERFSELLTVRPSLWTRAMLAIDDYSIVAGGSNHGLKYVFGGEQYARFVWTDQIGNAEEEIDKNLQPVIDTLFSQLMQDDGPIEERLKAITHRHTLSPDEWRYYFVAYEETLTDRGNMFTFPNEDSLSVERLSGLRLSGQFINPIYAEIERQLGNEVEPYMETVSKLETLHGLSVFLTDAEWTVHGGVDQEEVSAQLAQWNHLDRVEQGVKLVTWLNQQHQTVTP